MSFRYGNVQEVEDNIHTFKNYKPLSEEERGLLKQAVDIIRATPNTLVPAAAIALRTARKRS
jgi:predicted aldo/keto reductase-like oxidoreductase